MRLVIRYSLICWVIFYLIAVIFLSYVSDWTTASIRAATFIVPQIILFYLNLLIFLPQFFERKKSRPYFFFLFSSIILCVTVFGLIDIYLDRFFPLNIKNFIDRPPLFIFSGRIMSFIPPLVISALIRNTFLLQVKTKESFELRNRMLEAESKALKAQINPHFLFNTLNNIYSLSQLDHSKTGDAILQFSKIMRYVTYESNQQLVPLNAELSHLKNLIGLELLKDEENENISVKIDEMPNGLEIAPLILIPFVENCFKHGNHHDKKNGWITISVTYENDTLRLITENSVGSTSSKTKDKVGGVGMNNVRKRLSLLYPDRHRLTISERYQIYRCDLSINLKTINHELHNYRRRTTCSKAT